MAGRISEKIDVFSFGVLVLEIISGRRNTSFYSDELSLGLLGYVRYYPIISLLYLLVSYDYDFEILFESCLLLHLGMEALERGKCGGIYR